MNDNQFNPASPSGGQKTHVPMVMFVALLSCLILGGGYFIRKMKSYEKLCVEDLEILSAKITELAQKKQYWEKIDSACLLIPIPDSVILGIGSQRIDTLIKVGEYINSEQIRIITPDKQ